MCNIIVTSMLLLGGAATVNALTGMNIYLASFFIPWGVIFYTAAGGLKATFLASYIHTSIIFIVLITMVYTVYVKNYSSDLIYMYLENVRGYTADDCKKIYSSDGTIANTFVDDDPKFTYSCGKIPGNASGSYLTMISGGGLMFGVINIVGNFGTVFVDQSYWQSGIAAKPEAAYKGYMLGGLVWFTIPFALATSLGLAGVALQLPITANEAGQGLVPPAVATHLFGSPGSVMIAVMLFMAIVSTGSAESIAVSSIVAYDIYGTYINKAPTSQQILNISRYVIVIFGTFMGFLSCILYWLGLSLGWVYLFMGIMIGSAVAPLGLMMTWDKLPGWGAAAAAITGMACAILTWIIACAATQGAVTVTNLGANVPMLCGNLAALFSSLTICLIAGYSSPAAYDWKSMAAIQLIKEADEDVKLAPDMKEMQEEYLLKAKSTIFKAAWGTSILLCVIWPALSIPAGVFTKSYFAFWVFIALLWGLVATFVIVFLPIYENLTMITLVVCGLLGIEYTPPKPAGAEPIPTTEPVIEMVEPEPAPPVEKIEPPPAVEPEPEAAKVEPEDDQKGCGLFA
jgi:Na+/proline symporter